jgi:Flp pilus assembly protein TadD
VERAKDPQDLIVETARKAIERLGGVAAAEGAATPAPTAEPAATRPAAEPTPPVTAPAEVSQPGPDAGALAAEGRALLSKGDYVGALEHFRASVALKPDPQIQERIKKLEAYLGTR